MLLIGVLPCLIDCRLGFNAHPGQFGVELFLGFVTLGFFRAFRCAVMSANTSLCFRWAASASARASASISETSSTPRRGISAIRCCIAWGEVSVRTATSFRSTANSSPYSVSRALRCSTSSSNNLM